MATCSAVIARAFRMAKIVGVGDEPSSDEADEGLSILRSIYARIADGQRLTDVYETIAYEAQENERIFSTSTVTLPDTVTDEDTGAERRPRDLAVVVYRDTTTSNAFQTHLSDHGEWVRIDNVAEADEAPLSGRNFEGLAATVAIELHSTFGGDPTADTRSKAMRFQAQCWPRKTDTNEYF